MAMSAALDATRRLGRRQRRAGRRALSRKDGRSSRPGRLPSKGEVIRTLERRHDHSPKRFAWRGHRYHVQAVERCWTISRGGPRRLVERSYFRVRAQRRGKAGTAPERFEIYRDTERDTWHMQRRLPKGVVR
jgi:hypothetical protein